MIFRIVLLFLFFFIIDLYVFQAKNIDKIKMVFSFYQVVSALILLFILYSFTKFDSSVGQTQQTMMTMGLLLLFMCLK
jgi:hypothetical protein